MPTDRQLVICLVLGTNISSMVPRCPVLSLSLPFGLIAFELESIVS